MSSGERSDARRLGGDGPGVSAEARRPGTGGGESRGRGVGGLRGAGRPRMKRGYRDYDYNGYDDGRQGKRYRGGGGGGSWDQR